MLDDEASPDSNPHRLIELLGGQVTHELREGRPLQKMAQDGLALHLELAAGEADDQGAERQAGRFLEVIGEERVDLGLAQNDRIGTRGPARFPEDQLVELALAEKPSLRVKREGWTSGAVAMLPERKKKPAAATTTTRMATMKTRQPRHPKRIGTP